MVERQPVEHFRQDLWTKERKTVGSMGHIERTIRTRSSFKGSSPLSNPTLFSVYFNVCGGRAELEMLVDEVVGDMASDWQSSISARDLGTVSSSWPPRERMLGKHVMRCGYSFSCLCIVRVRDTPRVICKSSLAQLPKFDCSYSRTKCHQGREPR